MHVNRKGIGKGLRIAEVHRRSTAHKAGLRKYDRIVSVNGEKIQDDLDFTFFTSCEDLSIEIERGGGKKNIHLTRQPGELLGIEFIPIPVQRCRNRCIFCFIDQLPRGLRKSVYVKDEDYRYSFLNGNYITLTSLSEKEMERIIQLGLSPLYISVHATDPEIRCLMLNNKKAGRIMHQLRILQDNGISFHTQIVVCQTINDGAVLKKTIQDLLSFRKGLLSIAVVPVGLTKYQKNNLQMVSRANAKQICDMVTRMSERDKQKSAVRRLFIADELFIRAGLPIPESDYYEEYPQIENGVGLIRLLLNEWHQGREKLQVDKRSTGSAGGKRKKYLILSSVSACSYMSGIIDELREYFFDCDFVVEPVVNRFFGETVTVAGLLTSRDIKRTIIEKAEDADTVIVPKVILNYNNYTLDGFSIDRISKIVGIRVVAVENPAQLIALLKKNCHGKK